MGIPTYLGLEDHDADGNVTITTQEQALLQRWRIVKTWLQDLQWSSMGFHYKN